MIGYSPEINKILPALLMLYDREALAGELLLKVSYQSICKKRVLIQCTHILIKDNMKMNIILEEYINYLYNDRVL